jgi:hypothetical protein
LVAPPAGEIYEEDDRMRSTSGCKSGLHAKIACHNSYYCRDPMIRSG